MPSSSIFSKSYRYLLEIVFLYLLLFIYYIPQKVYPPVLPFVFIAVIGGGLFAYVLSKMRMNTPYIFIMLFIPVIAFFATFFEYPLSVGLVVSSVVCWRVVVNYQKESSYSEVALLSFTLSTGFILYLGSVGSQYLYKEMIIYVVIGQVLLLMVGKTMSSLLSSSVMTEKKQVKKFGASILNLVVGLVALAAVVSVIVPIVIKSALTFLISAFAFILQPLFYPIFALLGLLRFPEIDPAVQEAGLADGEDQLGYEGTAEVIDPTFLMIIFLILVAVLMLFLAKRKFKVEGYEVVVQKNFMSSFIDVAATNNPFRKEARVAPQEKIRRLVLELELLAARKGKGRMTYETVVEWLTRQGFLEPGLVEAYEKVRYGEEELTEAETIECEKIAKQLKLNLRALKKMKVKKEE
ncbi:hypothetical protein [Bacillus sp. PS06]|uniref:hypothetical protein n=1 Tax=Bacillus sp. PS06 TaxID=2764176 RepID=UPI001784EA63|nr:hypothetical protein [Bacillus sp. PS06]MBD8071509.1 hypothetical protein [Bacillus sp. PS06]